MIKKEQFSSELKIGKVVIEENGEYFLEEYDKDGNIVDKCSLKEVFDDYVDREFIKMKVEFIKEV